MNKKTDLVLVAVAERRLGLPRGWLRVQALGGRVPHLRADNRVYVHLPTVKRILLEVATGVPSPASGKGGAR